MNAPVSRGLVTRGMNSTAFAAAPPHANFPEGGLRVRCSFGAQSVVKVASSSITTGALSSVSAPTTGMCCALVGLSQSATGCVDNGYSESLFATWIRTSLAKNFQRYRVRGLTLEYVSTCGSTTVGRCSLGYVRDIASFLSGGTSSCLGASFVSSAIVDGLSNSVCFPVWATSQKLECIPVTAGKIDDPLYACSIATGASVYSTPDAAAMFERSTQGAIACFVDQATTPYTIYGKLIVHAVVDLYGLDTSSSYAPSLQLVAAKGGTESKGDSKSPLQARDDNSKVRGLDADYELVAVKAEQPPSDRAQGRTAGSKDDVGTSWFRKA